MNTLARSIIVAVSIPLAASFNACDNNRPAESAGRKIDEASAKAGEKLNQASERLDQKLDQAAVKLGEKGEKTGEAIEDAAITSRVKAAIFAEPGLKTLQINVETVQGIVTLSGSVDTQLYSDRAREIAGAVAGVKGVENRLIVKSAQ